MIQKYRAYIIADMVVADVLNLLAHGAHVRYTRGGILHDIWLNEDDVQTAKQIDQACLACPVIRQCALAGSKEVGVRGGVYWNGNGVPDKNRNSHKTPEIWNKIKERMTSDS